MATTTIDIREQLPDDWREAMTPYLDQSVVASLNRFLTEEYASDVVYPPQEDLFRAFRLCPLETTQVLILGQDPYHRPGQAHGLSFSVRPGVPVPPSLRNIYRELAEEFGVDPPTTGDLTGWAGQGVLLLNAVLTVRAGAPGSHAKQGWEQVTDAAIRALAASRQRVVFVLWGAYAKRKAALVTGDRHVVLTAGHPSPMNVRGFRGCRPFGKIDAALAEAGRAGVRWV
ncbi:uracil-DNA glycosylase [Natronosporangium hydrolyticum]|uniref:Uracil-DNA glycosylase n=1 Tax=Natronosporangium hydrolyticum TaxID=2811111 RepID=A0A895YJC8_9ACTN|nr:uracil-DNA glycosylase [Natronosporangium hydrolyticum]QSB15629.1 uracil-DNA glycosylase [Natronosporangium hydrolyticum]